MYGERQSLDDSWLSDLQRRRVDEVLAGVEVRILAPDKRKGRLQGGGAALDVTRHMHGSA